MDIVFSNRVSGRIFKECARAIVDEKQYSSTPIELRKHIEDCVDVYMEQHAIVLRGAERFKLPEKNQ